MFKTGVYFFALFICLYGFVSTTEPTSWDSKNCRTIAMPINVTPDANCDYRQWALVPSTFCSRGSLTRVVTFDLLIDHWEQNTSVYEHLCNIIQSIYAYIYYTIVTVVYVHSTRPCLPAHRYMRGHGIVTLYRRTKPIALHLLITKVSLLG